MPIVATDGIITRYEVTGSGPPLLMFSPGGFDSRLENWSTLGLYARLELMPALTQRYTCITFDRRESGLSGGRVERLAWSHYVTQARELLDHLGIQRAFLMGGCVGCSSLAAFAVAHPQRAAGLVLFSPAGGAKYRMKQQARFAAHAAFVEQRGVAAVVERARSHDLGFTKDPQVGPWATVLRTDPDFATSYAGLDVKAYLVALAGTARLLYDRDTVPGVEPEDLLLLDVPAFIVPGQDESHATSAARYLQECLPRAEYWDVPVSDQDAATVPPRILGFLDGLT